MARTGDDPRLVEMLLEVAREMDAEADAIEAAARSNAADPQARTTNETTDTPTPEADAWSRPARETQPYPAARTNTRTVAA